MGDSGGPYHNQGLMTTEVVYPNGVSCVSGGEGLRNKNVSETARLRDGKIFKILSYNMASGSSFPPPLSDFASEVVSASASALQSRYFIIGVEVPHRAFFVLACVGLCRHRSPGSDRGAQSCRGVYRQAMPGPHCGVNSIFGMQLKLKPLRLGLVATRSLSWLQRPGSYVLTASSSSCTLTPMS
jgi:hypothetical protein